MIIWSAEIKELERLHEAFKGQFPDLDKELGQLFRSDDPNVILLYSRRCLEVIITDLCECELKRPRKTEPLQGIIDKLNKEEKIPSHIVASMHGLNSLSTFGTHPKDFDPEQVKPVLNNLDIIIKWYLRYKGLRKEITAQTIEEPIHEIKTTTKDAKRRLIKKNKKTLIRSGIILSVIIIAGVLYFTKILGGGKLVKGMEKSIAVLPFINDSPSDSNKYFIDGIMVDILNNLQTVKDLRVISRTSAEKYRNTRKSIPEIAKELGVNYIVEGTGQKSGNKMRLSVNLLKAIKEIHLWGDSYEKELHEAKDIFDIQSQVANSITSELKAIVSPQEKQTIEKIPTKDLDAYEAVMKGNFYLNKLTNNDFETAMKYFELAKEKDPNYALAYVGIADVWAYRQQIGITSPNESAPKQSEPLKRAMDLDSTNAAVQSALATFRTWTLWDWIGAESACKKSISLNPNDAETRTVYSQLLACTGRNEEALKQIEVAVKLDPLDAFTKVFYGITLVFGHKYNEAIKAFQDALKIEPTYGFAQSNLGTVFYLLGKYKEALEQFKLANAFDTELVNALEKGYLVGGFKGAQLSYAKVVELRFKNSYWSPWDIAGTYAEAGEKDKTFYWLEQAYKIHDPALPYLIYPALDNLHDDPRFQDLCIKMKLPFK